MSVWTFKIISSLLAEMRYVYRSIPGQKAYQGLSTLCEETYGLGQKWKDDGRT